MTNPDDFSQFSGATVSGYNPYGQRPGTETNKPYVEGITNQAYTQIQEILTVTGQISRTNQELERQLNTAQNELKDLRDTQKDIKDEMDSSRSRILETMSVFFSLFAIITVNLGIFSQAKSVEQAIIATIVISSVILITEVILLYLLFRLRK